MQRRVFLKLLDALGVVAASDASSGCASEDDAGTDESDVAGEREFEYVFVGSGAGGGPLAANLARAGHSVQFPAGAAVVKARWIPDAVPLEAHDTWAEALRTTLAAGERGTRHPHRRPGDDAFTR